MMGNEKAGERQGESSTSPSTEPTLVTSEGRASVENVHDVSTPSQEDHEYMSGPKLWLMLACLILLTYLVLLDMSVIVTAIPEITTHFNSLDDIGWYASAYNICIASVQPIAAKLYQYINSKALIMSFFLVFEIGNAISGAASSSLMLILGRAVAGLGGSGLQIGGLSILTASVPLEKRPALIGMWLGISQLGILSGPLIGGALTEYSTWRWCFYINLPIGAITTLAFFFCHVPDRHIRLPSPFIKSIIPKLDLPGFALFTPSAVMILLALQFGEHEYGWSSSITIGLLVGGIIGLIAFAFWERRVGEDALIPMFLVAQRRVWTSLLGNGLLFSTIFTASYYLSVYFQTVREEAPLDAGIDVMPNIVSQMIFAGLSGIATGKLGYYLPFGVSGGIILTISHGLLSMLTTSSPTVEWAAYQVLLGLGRGLAMQVGMIAVQAVTSPRYHITVNGLIIFCQNFCGALMLTVASVIFTNVSRREIEDRLPGIDGDAVIAAGGRNVRGNFGEKYVDDILESYSTGVRAVFYLLTALGALITVLSFGMGWVDIRKKKVEETEA